MLAVGRLRCCNVPRGARSYAQKIKARSIIYENHGDPSAVIKGHTYDLFPPDDGRVILKIGLASLNPADINVLQGVYPTLPQRRRLPKLDKEHFVGGNEGFGIVQNDTARFKRGDWVSFAKPQMGVWSSDMICDEEELFKIERRSASRLTPVMASTLQVNPPTAFRMLHDFADLKRGDVIIQNAANSAVGQAVIQIASRRLGVETINLVRHRNDHHLLERQLKRFGTEAAPAHVYRYEDIADKNSSMLREMKKVIAGRQIKLGLNAVCGRPNSNMAKLMGADSTLVTYGAMSKEPFSVPAGLMIFKNLSAKGFMMNQWHASHGLQEREHLLNQIVDMYEEGILEAPSHRIVDILESDSKEDIQKKASKAIKNTQSGFGGNKYFFSFGAV